MTAPYNAGQLAAVQYMIDSAKDRITATGTLTSRDTTGAGAMCIIDPSSQPVPVKVPLSVPASQDDRVGLIKFGSDWVVVLSFGTSPFAAPASVIFGFGAGFATSSTLYSDMPGPPQVTFVKRFDWTWVDVDLRVGSFTNVNATAGRFGVQVNGVDYDVFTRFHNTASIHMPDSGLAQLTDLPAGEWTVSVRWKRASGTGEIRVDNNDYVVLHLAEVAPA